MSTRKANSRKAKAGKADGKDNGVARNAKGGVLVKEEEIKAAFDFFDIDSSGKITLENLKSRLGAFYKQVGSKAEAGRRGLMRCLAAASAGRPKSRGTSSTTATA